MKIGIIGAGNMGFALMNGFLSSGLTTPDNIIASGAKNDTKAQKNVDSAGSKWTTDNNFLVRESDVIILAVKPNMVYHVLAEVQQTLNEDKLVVSVALGFTVAKLESAMPPKTRVIRVMPNTPAMVQSGASVFCPGKEATEADCEVAKKLLSSVGTCYQIPEYQMDAVTAISGCGPAYMYMALEALTEAGVRHGLARNLALDLAAQTMLGSAKMVMETGRDPAILRGEVCSPGGATIDGVFTLEKEGFRAALMCAADAAFKKSVEFSGKK